MGPVLRIILPERLAAKSCFCGFSDRHVDLDRRLSCAGHCQADQRACESDASPK